MIDEENQQNNPQSTVGDALESVSSEPGTQEGQPLTEGMAEVVDGVGTAEQNEGANEAAEVAAPTIDYSSVIADLENQLNALKTQLEERTSQCVRIAADFDNYRKRSQREREEQEQQIKCSTINELLPVVDNFERARSQIKPQTDAETTIHKSYQSVYKQLVECLKRIGVSPMRAEGKEFDPNLHEAVMRQPTSEFPEGTVMEELQRGYLLGERVLRHALVKVAASPEEGSEGESVDQPTHSEG